MLFIQSVRHVNHTCQRFSLSLSDRVCRMLWSNLVLCLSDMSTASVRHFYWLCQMLLSSLSDISIASCGHIYWARQPCLPHLSDVLIKSVRYFYRVCAVSVRCLPHLSDMSQYPTDMSQYPTDTSDCWKVVSEWFKCHTGWKNGISLQLFSSFTGYWKFP